MTRRTLRLPALALAALACAAAAPTAASAASPTQVIKDCSDDGALQGNYSPGDLRKARQNLPTDIDEYSDCRDVLRRAELVGSANKDKQPKDSSNDSGSTTGGSDSSGPGTPSGTTGEDGRQLVTPQDRRDNERLLHALKGEGAMPVELGGQSIRPGKANAVAGDAELPGPLVIVLVLLVISAAGSGMVLVRKRVLGRNAS